MACHAPGRIGRHQTCYRMHTEKCIMASLLLCVSSLVFSAVSCHCPDGPKGFHHGPKEWPWGGGLLLGQPEERLLLSFGSGMQKPLQKEPSTFHVAAVHTPTWPGWHCGRHGAKNCWLTQRMPSCYSSLLGNLVWMHTHLVRRRLLIRFVRSFRIVSIPPTRM